MQTIATVVSCFPEHELTVRRLYGGYSEFRTICEDLGEAQRALRRWESAETASECRAQQYRELLRELEYEIAIRIEQFESCAGPRSQNGN